MQDACRAGAGRGGLGGPFPSPKRPFSGLAYLPPKQHLPAYPWLALSVRGAAGMGAQGRGRAVPSRAARDALRRAAAAARPVPGSARLGRGEGRGCPRLPAPPGGPGTAPHGTARPGARQSGAAPPRAHPARQRSPEWGWGPRLRPPRLRGARFCSSPRPACCSGVLRFGCATQPSSPDVRSFVLFAASSQPGMRSDSIGTHAACTVLQPQGCTQGLVTFLRTLGEMNSSPWGKKTGEGSPTEPVRWFWKYRGSFSAHL